MSTTEQPGHTPPNHPNWLPPQSPPPQPPQAAGPEWPSYERPRKPRRWPWVVALIATNLLTAILFGTAGSDAPSIPPAPAVQQAPVPPPPAAAPVPEPAVELPPAKTVTARELSVVAKNPDQYKGKRMIVFGVVSPYMSGSADKLSVSVGAKPSDNPYGAVYEHSGVELVAGKGVDLSNIVRGDEFRVEVTVDGATSSSGEGMQLTASAIAVTKPAK